MQALCLVLVELCFNRLPKQSILVSNADAKRDGGGSQGDRDVNEAAQALAALCKDPSLSHAQTQSLSHGSKGKRRTKAKAKPSNLQPQSESESSVCIRHPTLVIGFVGLESCLQLNRDSSCRKLFVC